MPDTQHGTTAQRCSTVEDSTPPSSIEPWSVFPQAARDLPTRDALASGFKFALVSNPLSPAHVSTLPLLCTQPTGIYMLLEQSSPPALLSLPGLFLPPSLSPLFWLGADSLPSSAQGLKFLLPCCSIMPSSRVTAWGKGDPL